MPPRPLLALPFLLLLAACSTTPARQPLAEASLLNLSDAKAAVLAYADDGRYAADLAAVAARAQAWLVTRSAARRPGERLAVVFDLDETLLSNLPAMRDEDFGYRPSEWTRWTDRADAPVIPEVKRVYDTARQLDFAVFFLTGRDDPRERASTEANLRRVGLDHYVELRMRRADDTGRTAAARKRAVRAGWEAAGWTIVASIGDQDSDLSGGHAERTFKLPNPFYRIP